MTLDRLTAPVWNPDERRVRAVWRVLITVVLVVAMMLVVEPLIAVLPFWTQITVGNVLGLIVVPLLIVWGAARLLDRRRLVDYGLRLDSRWWRELGTGAFLGLLMYAVAVAVLVAAGWGEVTAVLSPGPQGLWFLLAGMLVYWIGTGFWEELLFRGVFVKNAAEGFGGRRSSAAAVTAAVVVSTVIFAVVHIPQYLGAGLPLGGLFVMWLLLGGLLGLAYGLTGRLGLPIGLHITVNFALNNVFGLVPEEGETATLLHVGTVGPAWLADLGGVVHIVVILLGYALLLLWARRRFGGLRVAARLAQPPPMQERVQPEDARETVTTSGGSRP